MHRLYPVGKSRRPKFDLHLKIYDLNNVPLVSGHSFIKWHIPHSMHAEHRGRTEKNGIANHRVDYSYSKLIPSLRISMDKSNNLTECPIEFEVIQEFAATERITLGHVRLNLSEYVEESEAFTKGLNSPPRKRSSGTSFGPTSAPSKGPGAKDDDVEDGIMRRYLMQDSKVNSTLKLGILMVQVDGDRNFVAPALKTAPVFGGIAGLMAPEQTEDEPGSLPNITKSRDASEIHDLYRRTLSAYWFSQPGEPPADECIEDIFSGGNGWKTRHDNTNPSTTDTDEDDFGMQSDNNGTLRPSDLRRLTQQHQQQQQQQPKHHSIFHRSHRRTHSGASDKSVSTVTGGGGGAVGSGSASVSGSSTLHPDRRQRGLRVPTRDDGSSGSSAGDMGRARSGSLASMVPTLGSSHPAGGVGSGEITYKSAREIAESEVRDDLVAWKLPGVTLPA